MALTDSELKNLDELAVKLVQRAGISLMNRFRLPLSIEYKDKRSQTNPVTAADRETEALIIEELTREVPSHSVLSEEAGIVGLDTSPLIWVIDPLDGTTNYMNGLPIFSCSISLLHYGLPVIGAIFIPWPGLKDGKILHAYRDGGAWADNTKVNVSTHKQTKPSQIVVLSGIGRNSYWRRNKYRAIPGERRSVGSIAYEVALVADGTYQYALFSSPRSWDVAAGIVLVQEGGGGILHLDPNKPSWEPFGGFYPHDMEAGLARKTLQSWNQPILVGNHNIISDISRHLGTTNNVVKNAIKSLGESFSGKQN